MFKLLVLLFALTAIVSCCVLPQFDVLVSKGLDVQDFVPYSKKEIKDYDDFYVNSEKIPVLCSGMFSGLNFVRVQMVDCYIQQIQPGTFSNLSILDGISLRRNNIDAIEDGIFDNDNMFWIN